MACSCRWHVFEPQKGDELIIYLVLGGCYWRAFARIFEGPPKSLRDVVKTLASVLVKRLEKSSSVV